MTPTGQVFAGPLFYVVVLLAVWAVWAGVVAVLIRVASGHPQGMARPFFFLASLMAGMIFYFWRGGDFRSLTNPYGTQPDTAPGPSAAATPTGTPSASASIQTKPAADPGLDVHVPWAKIGAVTGAVLLVVALVVLTVFLVRRHTRKTAAGAVRGRLLRSLQGRHDKVLRDWAGFETDLVAVFEAPLLTDVTVPQTAAFTGAYGEAEHCRALVGSRPAGPNGTDPELDRYAVAVRELERTWTVALAHARKTGHGLMSRTEQRTVGRAVALLRQALDPGQPEAARQAFYEQALRLVRGLVTVPRQAVLVIERSHRLAVTASPVTAGFGPDGRLPVGVTVR